MHRKRHLPYSALCTVLLAAFFLTPLKAYAGVATTRHNLSASGPGTIKSVSETETCVFCHTPHGSVLPGDAPLWNHSMSMAYYTVQAPDPLSSMLSTVGQPDKGTKLCLSCHDGTVALGLLVNTPGPGSSSQPIPVQGVTGEGALPPGGVNFGTNLSGHHPVSIAVNDTLINDKLAQCATGNAFTIDYPAGPVNLKPTGNTYKGQPGVLIGGKPSGVQCASCHDPHDDTIGSFLVADGSGLCMSCHVFCF
jgi:predicted CXXCH cytochrome family protein